MDPTGMIGKPPPLKLGDLTVAPPVLLAPMSALTNLPMRALCEEAGCGLTLTEFIAAPALVRGIPKEADKLQPSPGGRPFGVQIFGRDPAQLGQAARLSVERGASIVDINMGCPAKKVVKGQAGSALMREPELAESLVRSVQEAIGGRAVLTVKIRSGWDEEHRNAPEFAARMVEAGARAVTVHGRTRQQAFRGKVDLAIIAAVKRAVSVPVIGNGDVVDIPSLERMFRETACDGVMIGRAALGNPWIFTAALAWWRGENPPAPPSTAERVRMLRKHLHLYLELTEERRAVLEMRKFAGWYLRGFDGASRVRKGIQRLFRAEEILGLLDDVEARHAHE